MTRSFRRRFFSLAGINILSTIAVPLAGLIDIAMLGHLPEIHFLAGVALAAVIFDVMYWTIGLLRASTTGLTAQADGAGDRVEVYGVLRRALMLAALTALLILLAQRGIAAAGFSLLSGAPEVETAGRDYFFARIWGAPAVLANAVLVGWLLGRERARGVLAMTLVAAFGNVGFNYLFIVRMGLAAQGAGMATTLSQFAMLAVGVAIYLRVREPVAWSATAIFDRARIVQLLALNRDLMIRTMLLAGCFALFTSFSSQLGTLALAANTLLLRLFYLHSYAVDGAAYACEILAGQFRGARDVTSLKRLFKLSLGSALAFTAIYLVALFATLLPTLRLLTSHEPVVRYASYFTPWLIPILFFGALAFIYDGLFFGLTEGPALRNAMALSALVFGPTAWLAVSRGDNNILWGALAGLMVARVLTLGFASQRLMKRFEAWPSVAAAGRSV